MLCRRNFVMPSRPKPGQFHSESKALMSETPCKHEWKHGFGSYGAHGCSSTWCRKCNRTEFSIERDKEWDEFTKSNPNWAHDLPLKSQQV